MHQLHRILSAAGIAYRIVGGLAVYLHVAERDPIQARLTPDVDAAIHRQDLLALLAAAESADFALPPAITAAGIPIARVEDVLDTKLTTYRLKDKVHSQDLDNVGRITPEIEASLPATLLARSKRFEPPSKLLDFAVANVKPSSLNDRCLLDAVSSPLP